MIGPGNGPTWQAARRGGAIRYVLSTGTLAQSLSFTRAGAGTFRDAAGALANAASDQPRFDHGMTGGMATTLLYEQAATNFARYASAPANDSGWTLAATHNGLSITRVATGSIGVLHYADYRVVGTATGSFTDRFYVTTESLVSAVPGDTFTSSCFVQVIGGSAANIGKFVVSTVSVDGAGNFIDQTVSDATISFPTLTRISATRTVTASTAAGVRLAMVLSGLTVGGAIDITLRIAGPQLEKASAMTSFVQVAASTVATRGADRLFLPIWSQPRTVTVIFEDGSTQSFGSASLVNGELPALNRTRIREIMAA
jgi:hypothetical protein